MAESLFALVDWLQANPALSAPLFVLVFCLVMAVGIPGGWFLLTSAGFLFGTFGGAALVTLGVFLAAWLTHLAIRTAFGRWLDHRAEVWQTRGAAKYRDQTRNTGSGPPQRGPPEQQRGTPSR